MSIRRVHNHFKRSGRKSELKALVCKRCWTTLFNTKTYEQLCNWDGSTQPVDSMDGPRMMITTSLHSLSSGADAGCQFCGLIMDKLSLWDNLKARDQKEQWCGFISRRLKHVHHPKGSNWWTILLVPGQTAQSVISITGTSRYTLEKDMFAYSTDEDNAASLVTARPLQPDVFSESAQRQMRSWIRECSKHSFRSKQTSVRLPTRVIDLQHEDGSKSPRIMLSNGQEGKYAALSYCWGEGKQTLLLSSNIHTYTENLAETALPQCIQDAIAVARSLGIRYLWVDALCILQDSPEDKAREIANMENIYRHALVTIVAASSDDASKGFLQRRSLLDPITLHTSADGIPANRDQVWRLPIRIKKKVFGTMMVSKGDFYGYRKEPIEKRGWTLQEMLLSNRLLFFASHTLQWVCRDDVQNLGKSLFVSPGSSLRKLKYLSVLGQDREFAILSWLDIVKLYSGRQMSVSHDRLPGLAGLVKHFTESLGSGYYAGLWEFNFCAQLMWETTATNQVRRRDLPTKEYRAPSWSWASVEGQVTCDRAELFPRDPVKREEATLCELIKVETVPKFSSNPYGEITDGYVTLRGKLRRGWLLENKNPILPREPTIAFTTREEEEEAGSSPLDIGPKTDEEIRQRLAAGFPSTNPEFDYSIDAYDCEELYPPSLITCFPIVCHIDPEEFRLIYGLLLQHASNGNYKRIGIFEGDVDWDGQFEQQPTVEITII